MSRTPLAIGAHPGDPDIRAGGLACSAAAAGRDVKFVSMTDGRVVHHELSGDEFVRRRRAEATAAADVGGLEYDVLDVSDGELRPTLENREMGHPYHS